MKKLLPLLLLTACVQNSSWTLHEDNDIFKPTKNNDRNYSQGLQVDRTIDTPYGYERISVGQTFFTPGNKQLTEYQPDDRPYAGFLYGAVSTGIDRSESVRDVFGVKAGVIGPLALGREAQNGVHSLLGQNTAKGWDNQLDNEPGVILNAERIFTKRENSFYQPSLRIGGNGGNVFTEAYTFADLKVGRLPDRDHNTDVIFPRSTLRSSAPFVFGFVSGGGRGIARNIFLDGNTFSDSPSIDKKPFVAECRLGLSLGYGDYSFTYTYVMQTKEFVGQSVTNDFGELTFNWRWR